MSAHKYTAAPVIHALCVCILLISSYVHGAGSASDDHTSEEAAPLDGSSPVTPVVFIPGIGGSRIRVKSVGPTPTIKPECRPSNNHWDRVWLNVARTMYNGLECWSEKMRLFFNNDTKETSSAPGLQVDVPGFGGTRTMELLDDNTLSKLAIPHTRYASQFVQFMLDHGYTRGKSLRGAPYDFRLAPHSQAKYFRRLKRLVVQTYRLNNNTRVAMIGHSMGGLYANYFLTQLPQEWKDRYIDSLITVSTPWYGTAQVLRVYVSGYMWDIPYIDEKETRKAQITHESSSMLLPRPDYWDPQHVLVETPHKNYTAYDFEQLFEDIHYRTGYDMFQTVSKRTYGKWVHPGVNFHCLYATGLDTTESVRYSTPLAEVPDPDQVVWGQGDGAVNINSLRGCSEWLSDPQYHQQYDMSSRQYHGYTHDGLLNSAEAQHRIIRILTKPKRSPEATHHPHKAKHRTLRTRKLTWWGRLVRVVTG